MNILIVDDDHNLLECLLALMPWKSFDCKQPQVAHNGQQALDLMLQSHFDLVISDLKMPGMDGTELCKRIKEKDPSVIVIFLSAYEDFQSAQTALEYGVIGYILKPLNRESLNALEALVKKAQSQVQMQGWTAQIFNPEYRMKIISAVFQKNTEFLDNMFEKMQALSLQTELSVCLYLMRVLGNYKQQKSSNKILFSSDEIPETRYETLVNLTKTEQMISYVRDSYYEEINDKREISVLVQNTKKIIEDNYNVLDYNASGIANRLKVSPAYLGRVFSREMGVGILDYVTELRLQKACAFLAQSTMSIADIAKAVGYSEPNYFAKVFRSKLGISPTSYRKTFYVG